MRAANGVCWRLGPSGVGPRAWDSDSERTGPRSEPHTSSRAKAAHGAWGRVAGVWGSGSEVESTSDRDWAAWLRCAVGGAGTEVRVTSVGAAAEPASQAHARRERGFPSGPSACPQALLARAALAAYLG